MTGKKGPIMRHQALISVLMKGMDYDRSETQRHPAFDGSPLWV